MSQKITVTDGPYITLEEAVAGALDGKEDLLVSINSDSKVVLYDGTKPAIGVMVSKLQAGDTAVRVRLLGKGGTVRMIQSAAITPGSLVKGVGASGRVATADAGSKGLGYKLSPGTGAAGDVIEVIDIAERTATPSVVALTSTDGAAAGASASLSDLAAEAEKIGDDVRAIHAALVAAGLIAAA